MDTARPACWAWSWSKEWLGPAARARRLAKEAAEVGSALLAPALEVALETRVTLVEERGELVSWLMLPAMALEMLPALVTGTVTSSMVVTMGGTSAHS